MDGDLFGHVDGCDSGLDAWQRPGAFGDGLMAARFFSAVLVHLLRTIAHELWNAVANM